MGEGGAFDEGQLLAVLLLESLDEEAGLLRLQSGLHEPGKLFDSSLGAMDYDGNEIGGHAGLAVDCGDVERLQLDDALLPQREEGDSVFGVDLQRDSQGSPLLVVPVHDVDRDVEMPAPLVEATLPDAVGEVGHQFVGFVLLALVVEVPDDPLCVVQHHRLDAGHLFPKESHFLEQRREHFWRRLCLLLFFHRLLFFYCLPLRHFDLKVIAGFSR